MLRRTVLIDETSSRESSPDYQPQNVDYVNNEWNPPTGSIGDGQESGEHRMVYQQLENTFHPLVSSDTAVVPLEPVDHLLNSVVPLQDHSHEHALPSTSSTALEVWPIQQKAVSKTASRRQEKSTTNDSLLWCMDCDKIIDVNTVVPFTESAHVAECGIRKELCCPSCPMEFNKIKNLSVHQKLVHELPAMNSPEEGSDEKFSCSFCSKKYLRKAALAAHYATHRVLDNFVCRKCKTEFEHSVHYNRHCRWSFCSGVDQKGVKVFCPRCSTTVPFESIAKHKKQHTALRRYSRVLTEPKKPKVTVDSERKHPCPECEKKFKRPAELKRHMAVHKDSRDFVCPHCGKAYTHERGLLSHLSSEHRQVRYKCPVCASDFVSEQSMQRHVLNVHPLDHPKPPSVVCEICNCSFRNIGALSTHYKYQHKEGLPDGMRTYYVCNCGRRYTNRREYREHRNTHIGMKEHRCNRCGKKFASRNGLRCHLEIHLRADIGDPTIGCHRCTECFKMLSSADALRRHRAVHQQYKCRKCGAKLPSSVRLRRHEQCCFIEDSEEPMRMLLQLGETMSQIGEGEETEMEERMGTRPASEGGRPNEEIPGNTFSCRLCPLTFSSFSAWQTHTRTHNGRPSKPHICWTCHKAFTTLQQLSKHKSIHNMDQPHVCSLCQRSFSNKIQWLEHINQVHPDMARGNLTQEQRGGASASVTFRNVTGRDLAEGLFRNRAQSADHLAPPLPPAASNMIPYSMLPSTSTHGGQQLALPPPPTTAMLMAPTSGISSESHLPIQPINNQLALLPPRQLVPANHQFSQQAPPISSMMTHPTTVFEPPHRMRGDETTVTVLESGRIPGAPVSVSREMMAAAAVRAGVRCAVCKHFYHTIQHLLRHLVQSGDDSLHAFGVYPCNICSSSVTGATGMADHLKEHGVSEPKSAGGWSVTLPRESVENAEKQTVRAIMPPPPSKVRKKRKTTVKIPVYDEVEHIKPPDGAQARLAQRTVQVLKCLECGKEFLRRCDMERHQRTHTGEKPFKCDICTRAFANRYNLLSHQKTHQRSDDKEFVCTVCEKDFFSASALKLHLRVHTGEKPLRCTVAGCDEMFRNSSDRLSHTRWHQQGCPPDKVIIDPFHQPTEATGTVEMNRGKHSTVMEQFNKTMQQISTIQKTDLKQHATSAFGAPRPGYKVQSSPHICISVLPKSSSEFRIHILKGHNGDIVTASHVCIPLETLRTLVPPGGVATYKMNEGILSISPETIVNAFQRDFLPMVLDLSFSPPNDIHSNGRLVWMSESEERGETQRNRGWMRECTVCDMTFEREEDSQRHYASEDHETAMLMCSSSKKSSFGPSLSAHPHMQGTVLVPGNMNRAIDCCQICGVKQPSYSELLAHIQSIHGNEQPRGMAVVRPAARTAPLH